MRILALDLGQKRIGVALSDPTGTIAQPFEVIPGRGLRQVAARIRALVEAHEVSVIVLGLPLRLDGREGEEAAKARVFAKKLQSLVSIPVELVDERLSTVEAERAMLETDESRARRRARRDAVAAALILQTYLDRRKDVGRGSKVESQHDSGQ